MHGMEYGHLEVSMDGVDRGDELEGKERKRRHKMEGARPGGRMLKQEVSDAAWAAVYAV